MTDASNGICAVDDCSRAREKREWCEKHYRRWQRHGTVELTGSIIDRTCRACGAQFRGRISSRYCSERCRPLAHPPAPPRERVCRRCESTFTVRGLGNPNYCSEECRTPRPLRFCGYCFAELSKAGRVDRRYCDSHCRRRATYDRHAEKRREYSRKWNADNNGTSGYVAASAAKFSKRRALKLSAPATLTIADWRRILRRSNGRCYYCHAEAKLTIEHVVPLHRGGTHTEGNVVAACGPCNSSKGGKLLAEWRLRNLRQEAA